MTPAMQQREREQPPVTPEPVFRPDAIYFDTNPLIAAGWPNVSAQFSQVLDLAERIDIQLFLPNVVQQELEEHRIRDFVEWHKSINSQIENLSKWTQSFLPFQKLPSLPPAESLRKELRALAGDLMHRFVAVPLTQRPLSELLSLAITRGATFEDGGYGFQDAVILCSVLDHMKTMGIQNACLVSEDHGFQSRGSGKLIAATGVTLKVLGKLNDLEDLLMRNLNSLVLSHLEHEKRMWKAALETHYGQLQRFISENLEINTAELDIAGTVKRLVAVTIIGFENVFTPLDTATDATQRVKVSVEVKVALNFVVDRFYSGDPEKLKVGQVFYSVTPSMRGVIRPEVVEYEGTVIVEAEASRTDVAYYDIRFISAHFIGKTAKSMRSAIFEAFRSKK
jgi:predicted nucleic acid-binding protein